MQNQNQNQNQQQQQQVAQPEQPQQNPLGVQPGARVVAANGWTKRGRRGGKEQQRKKDKDKGPAVSSKMDEDINYRLTPEEQLDAALDRLEQRLIQEDQKSQGCAQRVEDLKGKRDTIITTDWSNFNLLELVIATYDVVHSKVPNIHKTFDIVELFAYCQMVIDGRLSNQQDVVGTFRVYDSLAQMPGYLLDAGLTPMLVKYMENLAPKFTSDGVLIKHAPYEYMQGAINPQPMTNQYRLTGSRQIRLEPARNYSVRTDQYNQQVSLGQIRINVFDLINYRNVQINGGARMLLAADMNALVGHQVFSHNYQINPERNIYLPAGTRMRGGTFLYEFIDIRFGFRRSCRGILRMITNFDRMSWKPIVESQVCVHYICGNGDVRITRAPDKLATLFSTQVNFNGARFRASAQQAAQASGRIPATSFVKRAVTNIDLRINAFIQGMLQNNLYDVIAQWHDAAGRTQF